MQALRRGSGRSCTIQAVFLGGTVRERNRQPAFQSSLRLLKGHLTSVASHADTQSATLSCAEKTEEPRLLDFNKGPDA